MRYSPALTVLALVALSPDARSQDTEAAQEKWRALFDGQTLEGWTQRGGKARYVVDDGSIVGTTVPNTPNSFLCTDRVYGDFELELEFMVDDELNSGVQIRSAARKNGRVFGYQVEIDPSARAWSAGIYDEARRGWLNPLAKDSAAREAFKHNDWNHYRIVCVGDWLRTWINGVPAADLRDPMTSEGFIALQVHGVGKRKDPLQVRWRNIRIHELGAHRWQPIFDGESLQGWHTLDGGTWQVEGGIIHGTNTADDKRHGILLTDKRYRDFTARIVYRAVTGNSGFYFRCDKVPGAVGVHGFQAEIDAAENAGMLYETGGRARVAIPDAKLVKKAFKPGKWNEMVVSAHGGRIAVHVNGHRMSELHDDPGRAEGHLGIQLHGGQDMKIQVRRVELLTPAQ